MLNVYSHLEALWSLERVNASTVLSTEEKKVVVNDLILSLPDPLLVAYGTPTLDLVRAKLTAGPSIKHDEEPIDRSNNRPSLEATELPRRDHKEQEEYRKEAKAPLPLQVPNPHAHPRGKGKS